MLCEELYRGNASLEKEPYNAICTQCEYVIVCFLEKGFHYASCKRTYEMSNIFQAK